MGQDKNKQLTKLLAFVKDLYDNPDNKEFAAGIQSMVLNDIKTLPNRSEWTRQINDIYELCLRKNLREQAEDLYKDFPIAQIAGELCNLYVKMEDARRANDFDSFGRFLFLQIELVVETIMKDEDFVSVYEGIRNLKPITKFDYKEKKDYRADYQKSVKAEDGTWTKVAKDTVDKFLFIKEESVGKPLEELKISDRCRIVLYTVCYQANVKDWPKDDFDTLSAIYNVRNQESHTGTNSTAKQTEYYDALLEEKTRNYIRFLGFLLTFVNGIVKNYPLPDSVKALAGTAK